MLCLLSLVLGTSASRIAVLGIRGGIGEGEACQCYEEAAKRQVSERLRYQGNPHGLPCCGQGLVCGNVTKTCKRKLGASCERGFGEIWGKSTCNTESYDGRDIHCGEREDGHRCCIKGYKYRHLHFPPKTEIDPDFYKHVPYEDDVTYCCSGQVKYVYAHGFACED